MFLECGSDAQGLDAFVRVSRDMPAFNRPAPVVLEVLNCCIVTSLTPTSNRVPSSAPTILHSLRIISLSNSLQSVKTELFDLELVFCRGVASIGLHGLEPPLCL